MRDNSAIFHLALADTHLELLGAAAGVAQVHVTHVGVDVIEALALVRAGNVMARIKSQAQAWHALAELDGSIGVLRERADARFYRQYNPFKTRQVNETAEPFGLCVDATARGGSRDGDHRDHGKPGEMAQRLQLLVIAKLVRGVYLDAESSRAQARADPDALGSQPYVREH